MYKLTVKLTIKKSTLRVEYYKFVSNNMMRILEHIDKIEEFKREERFNCKKRDRVFTRTKIEYKIEQVTNAIEEQCAVALRNENWAWERSTWGRGNKYTRYNVTLGIPTMFQCYYYPDFATLDNVIHDASIKCAFYPQKLCYSLFAVPDKKAEREKKKNCLTAAEQIKVKMLTDMFNGLNKEL